jgi:hypothetical protein
MEVKKLLEEFDEETIREFVGKNADYYLNKWKLMAASGSKVSWNWAAFCFEVLWMAYRKMYLYALTVMLLSFVPVIGSIFSLIFWIGIGIFGNYLYGKFTYRKLSVLRSAFTDDELFKQEVIKSGGTSILGVFLFIILALLLALLISIATINITEYGHYL